MIYIDANIFIYAFFKPKKGKILSAKLRWCKEEAKKIVQMINSQQNKYCISLIQLSEIVNFLKYTMSWKDLQSLIMGLIANEAIEVVEINKMLYISAVHKITEFNMDANDISAYLIMKEKKINKIYTFDRHYEKFPDIICLPKIPKEFS